MPIAEFLNKLVLVVGELPFITTGAIRNDKSSDMSKSESDASTYASITDKA